MLLPFYFICVIAMNQAVIYSHGDKCGAGGVHRIKLNSDIIIPDVVSSPTIDTSDTELSTGET